MSEQPCRSPAPWRDAVRAAHHGLAVERERPGAQQRGGDGNRWIAAAPVVAAPSEQPHGVTVAADLQPIAVVLSWTQPVDAEEIVLRTVGRRETKDDILARRLA